jgi:hypothetical protein
MNGQPDLQRLRREIDALGDRSGGAAITDGQIVFDIRGNVALAVGSAFKLCILAELASRVASGGLAWDDVVVLNDTHRSLPSGILQGWEAGTALTVQSAAMLMTSLSDNTAADLLADIVGRSALEARSPRNRPFLTTREFFVLRLPHAEDLLERWRHGDLDDRRAVLKAVADRPLPPAKALSHLTTELSVEWWFTPVELCDLIREVEQFPGLRINPGLADPRAWSRIAFKGGSEPGAISWTTHLHDAAGRRHALAFATNATSDAAIDERRLASLYRDALDLLNPRRRHPCSYTE